MKSIDNKKARSLENKGFNVVNIGILTMNNSKPINGQGQVQLSDEIARLSLFADCTKKTAEELQALLICALQRVDKHSTEHKLISVAFKLLSDLRDDCITEGEFVESNTKELAA